MTPSRDEIMNLTGTYSSFLNRWNSISIGMCDYLNQALVTGIYYLSTPSTSYLSSKALVYDFSYFTSDSSTK